MDYQRPDPDSGRVEEDFIQPLKPMRGVSHRRLPAALPFAIAGLLVVTSVAFGAAVIRSGVLPNGATDTGIDVGDEPTEAPSIVTEAPVVEPTPEPTQQVLTLVASISGQKVLLQWNRYQGEDFAYYKIVRSTDTEASWPLGTGDTLVTAISDIDKLTTIDSAPGGKTYSYQVFAVKSSDEGYAILAQSNIATIAVPVPTPAPTPDCGMSLSANLVTSSGGVIAATATGSGSVHLSWTKYECDNFDLYGIVWSTTTSNPTLGVGDIPDKYYDNVNQTSDTLGGFQAGKTYYFRIYAYSESTLAGNIHPACNVGTILAWSNVASVTIPALTSPAP